MKRMHFFAALLSMLVFSNIINAAQNKIPTIGNPISRDVKVLCQPITAQRPSGSGGGAGTAVKGVLIAAFWYAVQDEVNQRAKNIKDGIKDWYNSKNSDNKKDSSGQDEISDEKKETTPAV